MRPTCTGNSKWSRKHPAHARCRICDENSLPLRQSDYWICCKCGELVPYKSTAEREAEARRKVEYDPHHYLGVYHCADCLAFSKKWAAHYRRAKDVRLDR